MLSRYENCIPDEEIRLFNMGEACSAWRSFGSWYIPWLGEWRFILWAPNAESVSVVGDFNNWDRELSPMERISGGVWCAFIEKLDEGTAYMYSIIDRDGTERLKADPFARHSQSGGGKASLLYKAEGFRWSDQAYMKNRETLNYKTLPISVYEVHAGSWKAFSPERPLYRQLGEALAEYCRDMDFSHVEFLPLTEHPFVGSWGYQVTGYFSPTSRYGSPEDFKYMVDTLHSAGIGVILDWVPAHFPRDGHGLAMFDGTPLFECKDAERASHPQWGTLIFDYESPQVQSFLISSACMFLEEYHVDALRVDAVSSMIHLNFGRNYGRKIVDEDKDDINLPALAFLRKLNRAVAKCPGAFTVAEESGDFRGVTADVDSGGLGFAMKWDMGFMHDSLDYMALHANQRPGQHGKLSFSMVYAFNERYVLSYSHDEVVYGKKSMLQKMSGGYKQKFAALRLLYTYQFAHPGKKLCFMGNEFAHVSEWNHDMSLDWLLSRYPEHRGVQALYRELNHLYTSIPALHMVDFSWDGFSWLNVNNSESCAIAFMRSSAEDNSYIVCACNFAERQQDKFVIGLPTAGELLPILSSDEQRFGGSGILDKKAIISSTTVFMDFPHSAELYLPPLTAKMFRFLPGKESKT